MQTDSQLAITNEDGSNSYWLPDDCYRATSNREITTITLHIVDADHDVAQIRRDLMRGVSSTYGVDSLGNIAQYVPESSVPFTNGGGGYNGDANGGAITIEIANLANEYGYSLEGYPVSNEALDATIWLVADIAKRNGMTELYHDGTNGTITWHSDYNGGKACPGQYIKDHTDYIMKCASEILKTGTYTPDPTLKVDSRYQDFFIPMATYGSEFTVKLKEEDLTLLNGGKDVPVVLSDIKVVVDNVNGISKAMNDNEGLFGGKQSQLSDSNANIMTGVNSVQNAFLGISNDLHFRVRDELNMITQLAQNYYDEDNYLSKAASSLADATSVKIGDSQYQYTDLSNLVNATIDTNVTFFKNFQIPLSPNVESIGSVSMADINAILDPKGSFMSSMDAEINSAKETQKQVDNFMNSIGTNLKGDVWNAVKGNLNMISALEKTKIDSCDKLKTACKEAMEKLRKYIDPDQELDTSQIPELETKMEELQARIDELRADMKKTHTVKKKDTDENGKVHFYEQVEPLYSASEINRIQELLNGVQQTKAQIQMELDKLKGFEEVVKEATKIINEALQEVYKSYGTQVNNYVSGREGSYVPEFTAKTFNLSDYDSNKDGIIDDPNTAKEYQVPYKEYTRDSKYPPEPVVQEQPKSPSVAKPSAPSTPSTAPSSPSSPSTPPSSSGESQSGEQNPEEKPEGSEEKPTDGEEKPEVREEKPTDGEEKPEVGEEKPTDGEEKPEDGEEKPTDGEEKPEDGEEKPEDGEEKPTDREEKPGEIVRPTPDIPREPIIPKRPEKIPDAYVPGKEETPIVDEMPIIDETPIIDDSIIEMPNDEVPIIDDSIIEIPDDGVPIIEDIVKEPENIIPEPIIDNTAQELPKSDVVKPKESNNEVGKAIATLAGVGAAIGAASYGAYKYMKSKEEPENKTSDEEENY